MSIELIRVWDPGIKVLEERRFPFCGHHRHCRAYMPDCTLAGPHDRAFGPLQWGLSHDVSAREWFHQMANGGTVTGTALILNDIGISA